MLIRRWLDLSPTRRCWLKLVNEPSAPWITSGGVSGSQHVSGKVWRHQMILQNLKPPLGWHLTVSYLWPFTQVCFTLKVTTSATVHVSNCVWNHPCMLLWKHKVCAISSLERDHWGIYEASRPATCTDKHVCPLTLSEDLSCSWVHFNFLHQQQITSVKSATSISMINFIYTAVYTETLKGNKIRQEL